MDLFEIEETRRLRRKEAAARLHALADASRSRWRWGTTTSWRSSSPGDPD